MAASAGETESAFVFEEFAFGWFALGAATCTEGGSPSPTRIRKIAQSASLDEWKDNPSQYEVPRDQMVARVRAILAGGTDDA